MRLFAWTLLGMAMAILIGSCTGYAAHEAEQSLRRCDETSWDIHETSPFCEVVFYGAMNAHNWEF